MAPFLEGRDILELVVAYIGFSPSSFYLKECSRYLSNEINGVVFSNEVEFFEAVERKLVDPECLELRVKALSRSLVIKLIVKVGRPWSAQLELLLKGGSIEPLIIARTVSPEHLLACSILRKNASMFEIALKFIERPGYNSSPLFRLLQASQIQAALMEEDAVEWLKRIVDNLPERSDSLCESLLECATKFNARRCVEYLRSLTNDWTNIPGMLEACAYAGDLKSVQTLCKHAELEIIRNALLEAVRTLHLDVAQFLRTEWFKPFHRTSDRDRMYLAEYILRELYERRKRGQSNKGMQDDPSVELLSWVFEGIDDAEITRWKINDLTMLEFACEVRLKTLCRYLVARGCSSFYLQYQKINLQKDDLLGLLDVCCASKDDSYFGDFALNPAVEFSLLERGIDLRKRGFDGNPIIRVLEEGFENATFSNRVELIKLHLMKDPKFATKIDFLLSVNCFCRDSFFQATPLGVLEVIGIPRVEVWTRKNLIALADFIYFQKREAPVTDEWKTILPNAIEVEALRDIKKVLIEHGADPGYFFPPDVLTSVRWDRNDFSVELVKRLIQGRADVNSRGPLGLTPLSLILGSRKADRKLEFGKYLLDCGADINARDDSGRTAFFEAIAWSDVETADWLMNHCADVRIADKDGVKPIDIARAQVKGKMLPIEILRKIQGIIGEASEEVPDDEDYDMSDCDSGESLSDNSDLSDVEYSE